MRMPVLFVGHGSLMNAIEENAFTQTLRKLGQTLPKPKAICVLSAHWVTRGSQVPTVEHPRTIHDFYGFPKALYDVQYPAPGAPIEAKRLAFEQRLLADHEWGFDHGTWSILRHVYPDADVL
jgi:4,5-DOPA dioxygenase extradiol